MRDLRSEILENKKLAEGIYRMTLETPKSEFTRPGQFAMVEVPDKFLEQDGAWRLCKRNYRSRKWLRSR